MLAAQARRVRTYVQVHAAFRPLLMNRRVSETRHLMASSWPARLTLRVGFFLNGFSLRAWHAALSTYPDGWTSDRSRHFEGLPPARLHAACIDRSCQLEHMHVRPLQRKSLRRHLCRWLADWLALAHTRCSNAPAKASWARTRACFCYRCN